MLFGTGNGVLRGIISVQNLRKYEDKVINIDNGKEKTHNVQKL